MVEAVEQGQTMIGKSPLIYRSSGPWHANVLCRCPGTGRYLRRSGQVGLGHLHDHDCTTRNKDILTTFQDEKTLEPIVIRLNQQESHERPPGSLFSNSMPCSRVAREDRGR